jgi:hypothetical protein
MKTLPGNGGKFGGSKKGASKVLTVITRIIAECLSEASPGYVAAWNGRMKCTTGQDQADQEHKIMVETAHQLYETPSQRGAPALTMMDNILRRMLPMNFQVTKEAAAFATEAYIDHMCTVATLIKTCCFEGAAYDLVIDLGPKRFTEWKAALINQAAEKVPHLFSMLEEDVRNGKFQPIPEEGALKYRLVTPGYDITELVDKDMRQLRKVCIDLRRAELAMAMEHDRVKAAAKATADAPAQSTPHSGSRRTSGADELRNQGVEVRAERPDDPEPNEAEGTEVMVEEDEQLANTLLQEGLEAALGVQERVIDGIAPYVADATKPTEEQDAAKEIASQGRSG